MLANNTLLLNVDSTVMAVPELQLQGEWLEGFEILKCPGMKQELCGLKARKKCLQSLNAKHGQN